MLKPTETQFGKALNDAIKRLGNVFTLGSRPKVETEVISTGSLNLDIATGVGGVPLGRVIEISGPESSGKTTIALHTIAEAQKRGAACAFIDVEHALDPIYAERLGVDTQNLIFSQPDSGEQALSIVDELARTGEVRVIVLDSVAALVPRAELDGEMGDAQVGSQARLMGQALRKLTGTISKANCVVIFINQIRQKIGVMFGNPETTSGGMALKFYSSIRMDIRRIASIKDSSGNVHGNRVKAKIVKNKVAPPFKTAEFDILYGHGVSRTGEIIDMALDCDLIKKSGAWYMIGSSKMQGRDAAMQFVRDHSNVATLLGDGLMRYTKSDDAPAVLKELSAALDKLIPIKDRTSDEVSTGVNSGVANLCGLDSDSEGVGDVSN
jgi:recombination protein RecA